MSTWLRCIEGNTSARRALNEQGTDADRGVLAGSAALVGFALLSRTWLREGDAALARKVSAMPLAAVALLALARCRRRLYVRYREAFGLAFAALSCWATITGVLEGRTMHATQHRGCATLLLALLLVQNGSLHLVWQGLGSPHTWLYHAALPLVLLPVFPRFRPFCERLVQAPGSDEPLGRLRDVLSLIHSSVCLAAMMSDRPARPPDPVQACIELNVWSTLCFGVLLPAALQAHMAALRRRRERWPPQSARSLALGTAVHLVMGSALLWTGTTSVLQLLGPQLQTAPRPQALLPLPG